MLRRTASLTLLVSCLAAAADAQVGAAITEVVVLQEGRVITDPAITRLLETSVGEPLSMQDVRETITHLFSLGRFDDVQTLAEPAAGGVRVRFVLVPLHPVDRIDLQVSGR